MCVRICGSVGIDTMCAWQRPFKSHSLGAIFLVFWDGVSHWGLGRLLASRPQRSFAPPIPNIEITSAQLHACLLTRRCWLNSGTHSCVTGTLPIYSLPGSVMSGSSSKVRWHPRGVTACGTVSPRSFVVICLWHFWTLDSCLICILILWFTYLYFPFNSHPIRLLEIL